ncbi:MAG TPA: sulfite exporter TauE/SafE family protein [Stellaceae bacterium]
MFARPMLPAGRLPGGPSLRWTSRLIGPGLGVLALASVVLQTQHLLQHRAGSATALLTLAIVFGAALVSSVVGFAFSALAGAGLVHLYGHPADAIEIMVLCSIAIQLYCVIAMRRSIEWSRLLPFLVGGALCVPVGVWLLSELSYRGFAIGLGAFLTGYGAVMLWRRQGRIWLGSWWIDVCVGALGGITGGLAAFPGAFVTMWCSVRGWDKSVQRAVTQPFILAMQLITLVTMQAQHLAVHIDAMRIEGMFVALFAAFIGMRVFRSLSNRQFAWVLNGLLMVSGALMIACAR